MGESGNCSVHGENAWEKCPGTTEICKSLQSHKDLKQNTMNLMITLGRFLKNSIENHEKKIKNNAEAKVKVRVRVKTCDFPFRHGRKSRDVGSKTKLLYVKSLAHDPRTFFPEGIFGNFH